ncbi:N-acetyl-gamma-glutamyl-phosphate reductase [Paraferrimonas sedimenticola]|uniref:N-acetyl-gamma-glutamyl-phosphate reductase n=1 Tax=Paraferrimonas sedimenticola TaxID=375674 RepID=A0AA37RVZ0_9GAMM|nr:N-acetyl-gamma-glutamyl-phosphate reductase [Paraferrimonas sedimenticola]GLP95988.1 N-acetyl-gamma-glutamyl-phosphate reductase [Paraferrimonas sedimenticola]
MKQIAIIGASGYTGAQLAQLVQNHPHLELCGAYVSQNSADAGTALNQLYPNYPKLNHVLTPLTQEALDDICAKADIVALCTAHEVSVALAAQLLEAGKAVFDLSGGYRLQAADYPQWYGFEHQQPALLQQACYGLVDWHADGIANAQLIAVPGCYPTASLLALKPIAHLLSDQLPVINAVSGVSGAGRKASMANAYCEVSLQAYGVLAHRHQPEIAQYLGQDVVFTPHLGQFKRGILATVSVKLKEGVQTSDVESAFEIYQDHGLISVNQGQMPKLDEVVNTPRAHLGWTFDQARGQLIVSSAIDNLLKGAASQALQCINIHNAWPTNLSLDGGVL